MAELTAGPICERIRSVSTMPLKALASASLVSQPSRGRCCRTISTYWSSGTGAGPEYWFDSRCSRARARPVSVSAKSEATLPTPSDFFTWMMVPELQRLHDFLDDAELQADGGGEILAVEVAAEVQDLDDELLDRGFGETGLFERLRFGRRDLRKLERSFQSILPTPILSGSG